MIGSLYIQIIANKLHYIKTGNEVRKLKIMSVVGARPNFMKIAPFIHELGKYPDEFEHLLVHTGSTTTKRCRSHFLKHLIFRRQI